MTVATRDERSRHQIPSVLVALGADGTIYVGSPDNNLYTVNPDGAKVEILTGGAGVHRARDQRAWHWGDSIRKERCGLGNAIRYCVEAILNAAI